MVLRQLRKEKAKTSRIKRVLGEGKSKLTDLQATRRRQAAQISLSAKVKSERSHEAGRDKTSMNKNKVNFDLQTIVKFWENILHQEQALDGEQA